MRRGTDPADRPATEPHQHWVLDENVCVDSHEAEAAQGAASRAAECCGHPPHGTGPCDRMVTDWGNDAGRFPCPCDEGAAPRAEGLDPAHCHRCGACICEQHTAYSDDTWDEQRRICEKCLSRPSEVRRVPESEERA